ncbi:uncharacterized protein METZ01_LOCUS229927, partial [marine metagenome]
PQKPRIAGFFVYRQLESLDYLIALQ